MPLTLWFLVCLSCVCNEREIGTRRNGAKCCVCTSKPVCCVCVSHWVPPPPTRPQHVPCRWKQYGRRECQRHNRPGHAGWMLPQLRPLLWPPSTKQFFPTCIESSYCSRARWRFKQSTPATTESACYTPPDPTTAAATSPRPAPGGAARRWAAGGTGRWTAATHSLSRGLLPGKLSWEYLSVRTVGGVCS